MTVFSTNTSIQDGQESEKSLSEKIQSNTIFTQGRQVGLAGLGLWARLSHLDMKHLFQNLVESGELLVAAQRRDAVIRREKKVQPLEERSEESSERDALRSDFLDAVSQVRNRSKRFSRGLWLELYGLYKQANHGDVTGKRPSVRKFIARLRYDAWEEKKSMTDTEAMDLYIQKVQGELNSTE